MNGINFIHTEGQHENLTFTTNTMIQAVKINGKEYRLVPIEEQIKEAEAILVTEDQETISCPTTMVWWVDLNDFRAGQQVVNNIMKTHADFKYFSTKDAAESYIMCNKPCLSVADILAMPDSKQGHFNAASYTGKLIDLAKTKMK